MIEDIDKKIIRELQGDIPVEKRPFAVIARRIGIPEEEVLKRSRSYLDTGYMRKFGAILLHREAGFKANGMGVWDVPTEDVQRIGEIMASFPEVTHCYERPSFDDWPYNLFTMIHSESEDGCREIAKRISMATGIKRYKILFSTKEFKKTSMEYF
ncbi:MAG: Lrp/AsnC family transcriptional regulator [Nitrospinae bacterium]|nr:Lrp/AsnC family transcriptional regulator [Nitrospinota bacterium]